MIYAAEQNRPEVMKQRKEWSEFISEVDPEKLVFIDESGVNIGLTRNYGRSQGKTRVKDYVPFNRPVRTTVVSSIRVNGEYAYKIMDGAMNAVSFKDYIASKLLPTLKDGDIVVMDNLSSHKVEGIKETIESAGATVKYLPPYSPDLNPIELLWSKMKSQLRKFKIRLKEFLPEGIRRALSLFTQSDCVNWFLTCGISTAIY